MKLLLLLNHESDFSHSDSILKVWLSRAWFLGFLDKNLFESKSQGIEKMEIFSQGTDDFKTLRCETLYIADYKYVNISSFDVLDIKLWLKEDSDLDLVRFIQSKVQNWYKTLSSLSHNFTSNKANLKIF